MDYGFARISPNRETLRFRCSDDIVKEVARHFLLGVGNWEIRNIQELTQLLAQFFSKRSDSFPHALSAASLSLMASRMLLRLRQSLKTSLESQHFALVCRPGGLYSSELAVSDADEVPSGFDVEPQAGNQAITARY